MVDQIIIISAFILIYFNISGLATTNILRLTKGNTLQILSSKCNCDNCGSKISPFLQLPIISFIICKGRCKNCNAKLPLSALVLEISILIGMSAISFILSFSFVSVALSFLYYEAVRIFVVITQGRRQSEFVKQYVIAVLSMIPYYVVTLFASLLYGLVK